MTNQAVKVFSNLLSTSVRDVPAIVAVETSPVSEYKYNPLG